MPSNDPLPDGTPVGRDTGSSGSSASTRGKVSSSFGSAVDNAPTRIDLNDALIRHPQATFVMRAAGVAMRDAGIDDGDVLLVDRAIKAVHGHVVVAVLDDELTCRRLWRQGGRIKFQAANPEFGDIEITDEAGFELWGVVTTIIKSLPA
ncbi:hypothetical protein GCM10027034_17870 [Ramlibacter solisilvae]|uniref:LexA family protein n=1 Tax=Ramlibacter tataouinensis TaxID=94132 RepID=UPI0009EDCA03|nr:translesion error-prone DNA polymerase V autoproteolytic subunit [Ramlibacter tataouinensis]